MIKHLFIIETCDGDVFDVIQTLKNEISLMGYYAEHIGSGFIRVTCGNYDQLTNIKKRIRRLSRAKPRFTWSDRPHSEPGDSARA